jgi:hypothetical protein
MIDRMMAAAALVATPLSAVEAVQPPAPPPMAQRPMAVPPPAGFTPAQPVDPARLAAAERMLGAMLPDSIFSEVARTSMDGVGRPFLDGDPRDAAGDPHHAERTRLTRQAVEAETARMIGIVAPEMRTLLARFYAARLGVAELDEAARFYSTPSGRRFAAGTTTMFANPAARHAFSSRPDPAVEAALQRLEQRIQAATAHLAPPPPRSGAAPAPPRTNETARPAPRRPRRPVGTASPREADPPVPVPMPAPPPPHIVLTPAPPAPPAIAPADPARLAVARRVAENIWPDAAFSQPLPLERLLETVLAVPMSSFGPLGQMGGVPANATLGDLMTRGDPNGREKARITARILAEELPRILPMVAPQFRAGMSDLYARTMTAAELEEAGRFYATPAGRALARESLTPWVDPEFVRGLMLLAPRLVTEGMGAAIRVGQATAHLPPPPPRAPVVRPIRPAEPRENRD